ncbi:MAG TPA: helix-turn-helix transcriptional regulator [Patescibacteria group bacterium]|nr:helix-turn-helix transcriptional regulator [Patescibacteria group bacterium]
MKTIPIRKIKEPVFSESFSIRNVENLLSGNDMIQDSHRHTFFLLLVLEKGKGEHVIDFVAHPVSDYSVFFMRPGQVHKLILRYGSSGYLIGFTQDFYSTHGRPLHQVFRKVSKKNYYGLDSTSFKRILSPLNSIFHECIEKQENYKEVIKANLDVFFIELLRHSQSSENTLHTTNHYAQERLEELLELLEQHILAKKQVVQYASMLHLTTYQLNAICKEMLGKTCSELINEHIILEAKRHLLGTSSQVNQIAYHLGYEDTSYFIRFFKKHTGYSPEMFRQNVK